MFHHTPFGVAAELLLHEHLLEGRPALAAVHDGVVAAHQARLAGGPPDVGDGVCRERAAGTLGPLLERDEDGVDVAGRAVAQLALGGCEREIHGRGLSPIRAHDAAPTRTGSPRRPSRTSASPSISVKAARSA